MAISDRLKNLDGHSSVSKEFRVYTVSGAILSVATLVAISYLTFTELGYNFQTIITERVHVNATSARGLDVEFDISLPLLPCSLLNIDANDPTGQAMSLHLDRQHHVWKHRIKVQENGAITFIGDRTKLELGSTFKEEAHIISELENLGYNHTIEERALEEDAEAEPMEMPVEIECGSCYGAGEEGECCNTCDDVKRAYNRKGWHLQDSASIEQCKNQGEAEAHEGDDEGCNVHGVIALSTGGGNFHVAPGRSLDSLKVDGKDALTIFDILMKTFEQWNVSHTVNKIRFGDEYPGHVHQLEGVTRNIGDTYGMYQYYFQIVPTRYQFLNGTVIQTNQYSVTEHLRHVNPGGGRGLPGVFFFYEISPLHVEITESYRKGWIAFFTSVCAVVGGVVTVMGMVDQFFHGRGHEKNDGLIR